MINLAKVFYKSITYNAMKAIHIIIYLLTCVLIPLSTSCSGCGSSNGDLNDSINAGNSSKNANVILTHLKQCADLVTTEATIRKLAIYDTSKHEKFSWSDISTWKYGDRKCIVPVDITIKYGYDLSSITTDNIKLTDDSTAVFITLPKPKIIDAGYNTMIKEGSVVKMSTGLRATIGHEVEEEIRRLAYEAVLKEDLTQVIGSDIKQNTQILLEQILHNVGMKNLDVHIIEEQPIINQPKQ